MRRASAENKWIRKLIGINKSAIIFTRKNSSEMITTKQQREKGHVKLVTSWIAVEFKLAF